MAADLAGSPRSGVTVQLCGDAHLSNFGLFGTPERQMLFDINDFDETLPGPWEWDVKRFAASFEIVGRDRGFARADRRAERRVAEAATRDSVRVFAKRTRGRRRPQDRRRATGHRARRGPGRAGNGVGGNGGAHQEAAQLIPATLAHQHHPIEEFRLVDTARKVVGVGSVGSRCYVLLMVGRDDRDPLFLQVKEAQASVLERLLGKSEFSHHGQRVVAGQRLMRAASDIFLGWQRIRGLDGRTRDYYVRQFHDWKGGADVDRLLVPGATLYARTSELPSPARTPVGATGSRLPHTWARATPSIARSRISLPRTQTRTSETTKPSWRPSDQAGWPRRPACRRVTLSGRRPGNEPDRRRRSVVWSIPQWPGRRRWNRRPPRT
jgi:uncharacterized protein (DUF2252 family)